ncbi:MAG: DUF937 domain-containing protein [Saprospiraceae bacterium]
MDLMNMLQGQLSGNLVNFLGEQAGIQDQEKTQVATQGIISTLIGALAKNASTPEGAASLNHAIERDHDGSILDNLIGTFTGNAQPTQPKALDGAGILSHLLGDKQNNAAQMIGKTSGLDAGKVMNLMTMLAPVVMGMLGKTKQQQGLNVTDIAALLMNTRNNQANQNPMMNIAMQFLDRDGDGNMMDDIAGMLGGFFGKK